MSATRQLSFQHTRNIMKKFCFLAASAVGLAAAPASPTSAGACDGSTTRDRIPCSARAAMSMPALVEKALQEVA